MTSIEEGCSNLLLNDLPLYSVLNRSKNLFHKRDIFLFWLVEKKGEDRRMKFRGIIFQITCFGSHENTRFFCDGKMAP